MKIKDVVKKSKPISEKAKVDIALQQLRDKREGKAVQISALQEKVVKLEAELNALCSYREQTPQASEIYPKLSTGASESAAVVVWSDHHNEEEVLPGQCSEKNEYNLDVYDRRFSQLVQGTKAWLNIEQEKTSISTLVIALLGDFFSNSIHEDLAESNLLPPVEAAYNAQNHLIGGIDDILANTPASLDLIVVCHSGNHARMTKKPRIATELGNSLETYMYYVMRDYYKGNPRVKFQIATGYLSYTTFFDRFTIRWHHGHQIKYAGGVGGITISTNKKIAQWNKARTVNLDVFGHHHQKFDGGNFICNGSMIGYNAFAVAIGAGFEKPSQTFFLVNKKWNEKTCVAPIFLD